MSKLREIFVLSDFLPFNDTFIVRRKKIDCRANMSVLNTLRKRVVEVKTGLQSEMIRDVLMKHQSDILEFQSIQLLRGKASSGDDIRPYYSEDIQPSGYFRSRDSAQRYSAWKENLYYPYSVERNPDAPNLYINGKFHEELGVFFDSDSVKIIGATQYANNIIAKYGVQTFGLMRSYWNSVFMERGAYNELITNIKNILYGR